MIKKLKQWLSSSKNYKKIKVYWFDGEILETRAYLVIRYDFELDKEVEKCSFTYGNSHYLLNDDSTIEGSDLFVKWVEA